MMFLLPKNIENDNGVDWIFRLKVAVVFCIGMLAALLAVFLAPEQPHNWQPAPTDDQKRVLVALDVIECIFFGIGLSFVVIVGPTIPKIAPSIRWKVFAMYICVGWILISWFPHIRLHGYYFLPWQQIGIDIGFHWTVALAVIFLSKFIFNFLVKVSGYTNKHKIRSKDFWKTDTFQVFVIIAIFVIALTAGLRRVFVNDKGPPMSKSAKRMFILIDVIEALFHGTANAFLFKMCFVIHKIELTAVKWRAIPVVGSIWFITAIWWYHSKIHGILPGFMGAMDPVKWILVEVFFHWTSIFAAMVVSYNIYGLIQIALHASKSPWRSNTNQANSEKDTQAMSKASETSSAVEMPVVVESSSDM